MQSFIQFHYKENLGQRRYILNTFKLYQEKATIPFIARYRRALTNNADANLLTIWYESYELYEQVQDRKHKMIEELKRRDEGSNQSSSSTNNKYSASSSSRNKILTPQLKKDILDSWTIQALDDLWLPFRTTRCTKAEEATKLGLKPLAMKCFHQECDDMYINNLIKKLRLSLKPDKIHEMIAHIIAGQFNEMSNIRKELRAFVNRQGQFHVSLKKESSKSSSNNAFKSGNKRKRGGGNDSKKKLGVYDNYDNWKCLFKYVKHHQILAIERGVKEKILSLTIHFEGGSGGVGSKNKGKNDNNRKKLNITERKNKMIRYLVSQMRNLARCPYQNHFKNNKCYIREKIIDAACEDAWKRLLRPSLIREVRKEMRDNAHKDAIRCFANNVKNLLMTKPYYGHTVLGIDPGYRAGCKCAVVNKQGVVLDTTTIWPRFQQRSRNNNNYGNNEKKKQRFNNNNNSTSSSSSGNSSSNDNSERIVLQLIKKHQITLIALGNGTASREVEQWLSANILNRHNDLSYVIVNEAGASVYSTSKEAQNEFGKLDPLAIGSIALARRVQNPLSELVKVPPQSLGVGMYQHDLSPKDLEKHLDQVVSIVVSDIGVDVNNASVSLLRRIAGLNRKTASAIFEYVRKNQKFKSRTDLLNVSGIGPKTYEQCIGFLKIFDGNNYLDATNIHPESYKLTENLCKLIGVDILRSTSNDVKKKKKKIKSILSSNHGIANILNRLPQHVDKETCIQILKTLEKPNYDPRENVRQQQLRQGPKTIESLKVKSTISGTVQNVAPFGAFVDIGIGISALLHNSKMSKEDKKNVGVGYVLEVEILSIDFSRKRISVCSVN